MQGNKARFLDSVCRKNGWQFTRFDYRGHGQSDKNFSACTLDDWIADGCAIVEKVTQGPQILIGSSMGAWIALHIARQFPQRTAGLLTIAAAPDFTQRLIWEQMSASEQEALRQGHAHCLPSHSDSQQIYDINYALIQSGYRHAVLNDPIPLECPVRLLHGTADVDVPHGLSEALLLQMVCDDASLTLRHNADHRFSDDACLALIHQTLLEIRALSQPKK